MFVVQEEKLMLKDAKGARSLVRGWYPETMQADLEIGVLEYIYHVQEIV
jgi:hypothetical protein